MSADAVLAAGFLDRLSSLEGRAALVLGGHGEIARAIGSALADKGAHVAFAARKQPLCAALGAEIEAAFGRETLALACDISKEDEVAAAVAATHGRFGRLDILVNNAGVTTKAAVLEMTLDAWEKIIRINLTGTMLCSQAAARVMVAGGGGRIINIASISGQRGGSGRAAYGASKAGVINLTSVLAIELGPHNILVNAIAPGPTDVERAHSTSAQRQVTLSRMAIQRAVRPDEIAAAALFLAGDDCGMITGHVLNVDGGFNTAGIVYAEGA